MKTTLNKVAAALAFIIGAMAVFAGGKTLLGNIPNYHVINWLLLYNYTMGIVTISVTAYLIWSNNKLALPAALSTFSIHAIVMLILQTAFRNIVAMESIVAMLIRLTTWFIIVSLMLLEVRSNKSLAIGA